MSAIRQLRKYLGLVFLGIVKIVCAEVFDAGGHVVCVVQTDNTPACWGFPPQVSHVPQDEHLSQISMGHLYGCGIRLDGTLVCWGGASNSMAQAQLPTGKFLQLSAGYSHFCGIKTNGTLACWGSNLYDRAEPPPGAFLQVSAGKWHTCGIRTDQTVACWGSNTNPYLEDAEKEQQATPPEGTFLHIAAGHWHTCGVRTNQTVLCWGSNNHGQASPPEGKFSKVSAGQWHSCGLRTDQTIVCWGSNSDGQSTPPAGPFYDISADFANTCGLRINNTIECWGYNGWSQNPSLKGAIVKELPKECLFYGIHEFPIDPDAPNSRDSRLFTIYPKTLEVNAFGTSIKSSKEPLYGLAAHPVTQVLYAVADQNEHLYQVNSTKDRLTDLGETGLKIQGLTFHPDGTLWGWTEKKGLIQIANGKKNVPDLKKIKQIPLSSLEEDLHFSNFSDLAWDNTGNFLYGTENVYDNTHFERVRLWKYEATEEKVKEHFISPLCDETMKTLKNEVVAIETLPDNTLLLGFEGENRLLFKVIDVQSCEVTTQLEIPTEYSHLRAIVWPVCHN